MNHLAHFDRTRALSRPNSGAVARLNIGCGRRFHADWLNLDLVANDPLVIPCDVSQGLPFADNTFDAVYHSHVLEHFAPDDGRRLVEECFRVLKPGGILRIVVPDLERIAKLYLNLHRKAWDREAEAESRYAWIKLELLDQMVRQQSGGMMGRYMAELQPDREKFVRSRIGAELDYCRQNKQVESATTPRTMVAQTAGSSRWRERVCRRLIKWLMGKQVLRTFDEAIFRKNGEIHRWMYDRYSLRQLCESIGFVQFECCSAIDSRIADFGTFNLDACQGRVFKPDSLFVECEKPRKLAPTPPAS